MGSGVSEGCSLTGCFILILREEKLEKRENEIRVISCQKLELTYLSACRFPRPFLLG
jgi:hypothetical protein